MRRYMSEMRNPNEYKRSSFEPNKKLSTMKRKFYFLNRMLAISFLLGFMIFSSFSVGAQTVYHVSTTGSDSDDGLSWVTPLRNIQTALDLANPGDEIWVAQGTYYPDEGTGQTNDARTSSFILKPTVKLLGGFLGVNGALVPRDVDAFTTILSGDIDQNDTTIPLGANSFHVVTGADNATLDGFTIQSGFADGPGTDENKGGGIFNGGTSPFIMNCIITNNDGISGGGMYNSSSSAAMVNVQFISNNSMTGAAVYNNNAFTTFVNCQFRGNAAEQGGAIYNTGTDPNSFTNCIISGNLAAQEGGGIYNIGSPLNLINCTVTGNNASIEAGGLYLENTNLGVFNNTILWNNMAAGVVNLASSTLTETNSTLSFANCLVENFTPEASGGTVGVLSNSDPGFISNSTSSTAPNTIGDFRLLFNSVALNVGDNSLNTETQDVLGNARIQDTTIDLGAIEGGYSRIYFVSASTGSDTNSGLNWNDALQTVQTALDRTTTGDVIWVAKGTYYPDDGANQTDDDRTSTFTLKEEVKLYGGFSGTETALSERNIASNETILSGDLDQNDAGTPTGTNAYHVVSHANGFTRETVINGFTISGGLANGTDARDKKGGGMILEFADLTIENCIIQGNEAEADGGGIYDESCTFLLTSSRISGNTAAQGGGIFNIFDAMPEITDCIFNGNTATSGAGAFNTQALPSYKNCSFELNSAGISGGGMLNDTASGDVINTMFKGNSAANGAGAYNINFASPFFTNCLFTGNNASSTGGGIDNSVEAAPTLTNCTFSGNSAGSDGGAIFNSGSTVNINARNVIIWNNQAGGVTNTMSASISENSGSSTTFTTSLAENFTVSGGVIANSNPSFVIEVDPTTAPNTSGNFRLLLNSIAVNVGDNASNTETEDLDGNTRIQDTTIDLGPYEGETTVTTWQGTSSTDWALGSNWTDGVPSAGVSAVIPASASTQPEIDASIEYEVNDITIESGADVTVNSDAFFTVNGNLMGTGDLVIESGGSVIVNGTSTVNTIYKRTLDTTNEYWISSPVIGQDVDDFAMNHPLANGPGADDRFLRTYNNTTQNWEYYQAGSTGTGDFASGVGYSIQLTTAGDLTFSGGFPTSDVSTSVTVSNNAYNFVGNPYPTSIAANAQTTQTVDFLTLNKNILAEETLWIRDAVTGNYVAINQVSGSRYLAPGQGFVIATALSGTVQLPEVLQSHQSDTFQRPVGENTNTTSIRLEMGNGTDTKAVTLAYRSDATTDFDGGLDSSVFDLFSADSDFDFYTQLVTNNFGRKIEIQSLPDSNYENMVIPIGFKALNGEEITITAADIQGLPSGYGIYIEDKDDNSFTSIGEAGESFTTTLTADADGVGRFFIHVSNVSLSNEDVVIDDTRVHLFLKSGNLLQVNGIEMNSDANVMIYSMTGQQVFKTNFVGELSNEIPLPRLRTGLYIIHVNSEKGRTIKKVLKH